MFIVVAVCTISNEIKAMYGTWPSYEEARAWHEGLKISDMGLTTLTYTVRHVNKVN